jgi:hypothetical protein
MIPRELTMAKKNTKSTDPSAPAPASTPAKRRVAAPKKSPAAPPIDVATVGGTEPLETASDTGARTGGGVSGNGDYQPSHDEIAQAAYFRHLNRGGSSGDEFNDWVEAERELRHRRR